MGVAVYMSSFSNASDELFREWVDGLIDNLIAAGMAQTSDTGQIDTATVTAPAASSTYQGYVVLRWNDALHATHPLYVRLEFGSNGSTAGAPSIRVTIGKGTDGAGTLTGILFGPTAYGRPSGSSSYDTTTQYTHYVSVGPGYMIWAPFVDDTSLSTSQKPYFFAIERSRSASGDPTEHAVTVVYRAITLNSGTTATSTSWLPAVRTINYQTGAYFEQAVPVTGPYSFNGTAAGLSTSVAAGGIGPALPWVLFAPGVAPWQSCSLLCIPMGDYPGVDFTTTLCGDTLTFRPVGFNSGAYYGFGLSPAPNTSSSNTVHSYYGLAIRWEV